jgi:DNA polymerase III delta subunit
MLGGVAASELKPVYLLHGSDRPKIARAVRRLRDRMGDDATEHLDAREATGVDAVAACNAMGLFVGEGRLVIVDEVERWKAADVKEVAAYLASPAPATVLALVAVELKADSALAKAIGKAGQVLNYEVTKRKLPDWVAEQFGRFGAKADADACRALIDIVGDDLDELTSEIDKLATWAAGEPITLRESSRWRRSCRDGDLRAATWGARRRGSPACGGESWSGRTGRVGRADADHQLAREPSAACVAASASPTQACVRTPRRS